MDISFLETVVAVYHLRSFYEAANERMISPSTVSKHVSAVEKELGIKLFHRATKTSYVSITEAGKMLLNDIDSYVTEYSGILKKAQMIRANEEKQLTLGYVPVSGSLGEDRIISAYCKKYPKIKINLIPSSGSGLAKMLSSGRVDGIFAMGAVEEPTGRISIDCETLDSEKYGCILTYKSNVMFCELSENHYLAGRQELTMDELKHETFLINNTLEGNDSTHPSVEFMRSVLQKYNHQFMDYTLKSILHDFVATGKGIMLSTTYSGEEYRGIRFIPMKEWNAVTQGWFIYKKDNQSGVLRSFRQFAANNCLNKSN